MSEVLLLEFKSHPVLRVLVKRQWDSHAIMNAHWADALAGDGAAAWVFACVPPQWSNLLQRATLAVFKPLNHSTYPMTPLQLRSPVLAP